MRAIGLIALAVPIAAGGLVLAEIAGHWLVGAPLWAAAGAAIWKARPALVREFRLQDQESGHPVAVLTTGEQRSNCPCCGYPAWEQTDDTCRLCDWPPEATETAALPGAIDSARSNFSQHLSVYHPARAPDWIEPQTQQEIELKRRLITSYKRIQAGKAGEWYRARSLENKLHAARYRGL